MEEGFGIAKVELACVCLMSIAVKRRQAFDTYHCQRLPEACSRGQKSQKVCIFPPLPSRKDRQLEYTGILPEV